ncbi:hypothetical protein ISCGN_002458 [Ixodes scapularis]
MSLRERKAAAAAVLVLLLCEDESPPKKTRPWVKPYIQKREQTGAHHSLTRDLLKDPNEFRRYLRMTPEVFQRLADGIRADVQKQDTVMRTAISAEERLEMTLRFLASDAAFPIGENLMRPYPGQAKQPEKIYNYRHSRARRVSENFFGVLAQRFRILLRPIQALPQNVTTLVLACCGLHNMLRDEGVDTDMKPEKASDVGAFSPLPNHGVHPSVAANNVRKEF